jgi:hypothetical protein
MSFADLQQKTGMGERALSRALAALYFVGTVTANAKRACINQQAQTGDRLYPDSGPPSTPYTVAHMPEPRRQRSDRTAPAMLSWE